MKVHEEILCPSEIEDKVQFKISLIFHFWFVLCPSVLPSLSRVTVCTPGSLAVMSLRRSPTVVNMGVRVKRHC